MTEAGVAVHEEPAWIPACAGMTDGEVAVRAEAACGEMGQQPLLGHVFMQSLTVLNVNK